MKKRKIHIKNREKVNGFTSEIVRGAKDIKILNAEKSFLLHASKIMDVLKENGIILKIYVNYWLPLTQTVVVVRNI